MELLDVNQAETAEGNVPERQDLSKGQEQSETTQARGMPPEPLAFVPPVNCDLPCRTHLITFRI